MRHTTTPSFKILIIAIKKAVAFNDDLVKKLNGVPLIHRTIDKAKEVVSNDFVHVITDSQEISLICMRNHVHYYYDKDLNPKKPNMKIAMTETLAGSGPMPEYLVIMWPYVPMLESGDIVKAVRCLKKSGKTALVTVDNQKYKKNLKSGLKFSELLEREDDEDSFIQKKAFLIVNTPALMKDKNTTFEFFKLENNPLEIRNFRDWWICEKLLRRKKIVFRIIGNNNIGTGHVYRALSIAKEITDHEIIFVTNKKDFKVVNKIAGSDYQVSSSVPSEIENFIIRLKPDMIINDILGTSAKYISRLKRQNIKVVNFEDLSTGAVKADLVFNELYGPNETFSQNAYWGYRYVFLRDEFQNAKQHRFKNKADSVLLSFGGSDPNNLTMRVLSVVVEYCRRKEINIFVVVGYGYKALPELNRYIDELNYSRINLVSRTGIMSHIMELTQIAISANGLTVYELAHMNIPAVIISHHSREGKHNFSKPAHGFINMGVYNQEFNFDRLLAEFIKLVENTEHRRNQFKKMTKFSFHKNKDKVVRKILKLLDE